MLMADWSCWGSVPFTQTYQPPFLSWDIYIQKQDLEINVIFYFQYPSYLGKWERTSKPKLSSIFLNNYSWLSVVLYIIQCKPNSKILYRFCQQMYFCYLEPIVSSCFTPSLQIYYSLFLYPIFVQCFNEFSYDSFLYLL